jgi:hypothetical protein
LAVESLPLPLIASPVPPYSRRRAGFRTAIALVATSVLFGGLGSVYMHEQMSMPASATGNAMAPKAAMPPAPAMPLAGPANSVTMTAPSVPDAGPARRLGAGTAVAVAPPAAAPATAAPVARPAAKPAPHVASAAPVTRTPTVPSIRATVRPTASYFVRNGDDFGAIASRLGISAQRLALLNPGLDSSRLSIGQPLHIG